jgi:hypothetical protein
MDYIRGKLSLFQPLPTHDGCKDPQCVLLIRFAQKGLYSHVNKMCAFEASSL